MFEAIVISVQALTALIIGGIVAYIAYQQWQTNRYKLKLDLYEKRYKVYEAVKILLGGILRDGKVKNEAIAIYMMEIREVDFLFDDDIISYLKDAIYKKALDMDCKQEELFGDHSPPKGPKRSKLAREKTELLHWFTTQFDVAKKKFEKYLSFKKIS